MSESKIQVKVGLVEFSGEGQQDWLAKQLDKILEKVPELLKIEVSNSPRSEAATKSNHSGNGNTTISGLSVLNIAGKLSNKSGSDLVIIAATYLHFVEGKTVFTRDEISSTMKKATGIYKESFMSNLTTYLTQLEKNNTFLKNGNTYSLNSNKVNELQSILSQ